MYHRFDRTAARILLILQSEVLCKQKQLDEIDENDAIDKDEKRLVSSGTIPGEIPGPLDARDSRKKNSAANSNRS